MNQITYFFRPLATGYYSIEFLFKSLSEKVEDSKLIHVPFLSSGIYHVLRNIWFARKNQGAINHVTGDIHYIILGFNKRNINILTIHDCSPLVNYPELSLKYWIFKCLWYKWPVRKARVVTTVSEKSRDEILKHTGCHPSKVVTIPNFINPAFIHIERQFNSVCPRLLHIGSTKNKNLTRVLQAIKDINCELHIIGKVSQNDKMMLMEHRIKHSIQYDLSIDEIRRAYTEMDILMFVSTYEGFGLPIIEAQATGRVVITSDIRPCREVAGTDAICVDPLNVSEIRKAIISVTKDEKLRNKSISAGLLNVKKYTLERVQNQYMTLYQKLLSAGHQIENTTHYSQL